MSKVCSCNCGCEPTLDWHREIRCACSDIGCLCVPWWQRLLIRLLGRKR